MQVTAERPSLTKAFQISLPAHSQAPSVKVHLVIVIYIKKYFFFFWGGGGGGNFACISKFDG